MAVYPRCRDGYHGVGPVCGRTVPPVEPMPESVAQQTRSCVTSTVNIVLSPLILAVNIAALGSA